MPNNSDAFKRDEPQQAELPRMNLMGINEGSKKEKKIPLKYKLFKIINLLSHNNRIKKTVYIILLAFEFLQLLAFLFFYLILSSQSTYGMLDYEPQKSDQLKFGRLVNIINLKQILDEFTDQYQSYAIQGLALFLLTIHICFLILVGKNGKDGFEVLFTGSSMRFLIKVTSISQIVLMKILLIPVLIILFSVAICERTYDQISQTDVYINLYYDYECWNIPHTILAIICFSYSILTIALAISMSLLFNDPRSISELPWGCSQSKAELIKTFIKVLIAVTLQIEFYSRWVFLVLQVANVMLAYLLIHQRFKFFYHYQRKVLIATIIEETSYLWLSFVLIIINVVLKTVSYYTFAYIIISTVAFNVFMLINFLNRDSILKFTEFPNFVHESEYEQFFLILHRYLRSADHKTIDKTLMLGMIKQHQKICSDSNCICEQLFYLISSNKLERHLNQTTDISLLQDKYLSGSNRYDKKHNILQLKTFKGEPDAKHHKIFDSKFKKIIFKFMNSKITKAVEKLPSSIRLRFIQVNILQEELSNEFKSYFMIIKIQKEKPSLQWQFHLYQMKQNVEKIMYKKYQQLLNNKQGIDVIKVYDFETMFIKIEREIINTSENCLHFWKELMDKRLDVNKIHDFGVQISNQYNEVSILANKMIKMFPNHLMFLKIYASFLADVMNNENESYEITTKVKSFLQNQNNLQKLDQDEDKFFGYNNKTVIITMTVTPKDMGNIVNANFETKYLLGYKHKEIKGRNVRILMPKILSDNHDTFIQSYFDTAKAKILEKQRIVIAKDKDGYILPVYILVKAIPNLKRNLTFVGFLRRLEEHNDFIQPPSQFAGQDYHIILSDLEGSIHGFTQNCWETFGFKPSFFFNQFGDPDQQMRIEKIIRNLRDPTFINKLELKKDGSFCSLDTGLIMESMAKELLNRDEQEMLLTISGSYNINLQIDQMSFANGKIVLVVYKILKVSRIIRSQNVLDMIQMKIDEVNELSFDFDEDENDQEQITNTVSFNNLPKQDSLEFEDDVISRSEDRDEFSRSERSHGTIQSIDVPTNYQNQKYLMNFKKQISTREMPASIIKLNRLVIFLGSLVLIASILDIIQSFNFYSFSKYHFNTLQLLHEKHYILGRICNNIISLALINVGIQQNSYKNFTSRNDHLTEKLDNDIKELEQIEETIQGCPYSSIELYTFKNFVPNLPVQLSSLNQDASVNVQEQSMRYAISQIVSKVQTQIHHTYSATPQQFDLTPEVYSLYDKNATTFRNESQKSTFYVIQNTLQQLIVVNEEQNQKFAESFIGIVAVNRSILISGMVFFTIFVLLSGAIVFPIVIGVQKNKVMILSIYFELPPQEIERLFYKCYQFMVKVESKLDDAHYVNEDQEAQLRKYQEMNGEYLNRKQKQESNEDEDDNINSSKSSDRQLVEPNSDFEIDASMNRRKSVFDLSKRRQSVYVLRQMSIIPPPNTIFGKLQAKNNSMDLSKKEDSKDDDEATRSRDMKSSDSLDKKSANEQPQDDEEMEQRAITQGKMFKEIKVRNNKINLITLGVIITFLGYFSASFYINIQYIKQISNGVYQQMSIYQENLSLEYSYLYFMQDIMKNQTKLTSDNNTTYFQKYLNDVYSLELAKSELKKQNSGILSGYANYYFQRIDNTSFCSIVQSSLDSDFEKAQCPYFGEGIFNLGEKNSIFKILYEFQQLRVKYETQRVSMASLRKLLNDQVIIKYSIISNTYYRAAFAELLKAVNESITAYYDRINIFVKLRFSFFVIFVFISFTGLWRVFLKSIQAEVIRSKGMLNMIPTEFLEKDNNLKKLSLNKLINLN